LRRIVVGAVLAFAVALAAIIGTRMSVESMAVVVGVMCGVAASIPVSLLILLVSSRRDYDADQIVHRPIDTGRAYPPVVVIQGGTPGHNQLGPPYSYSTATMYEPGQRQFHLVGQSEDLHQA
jgi:hypothetical protein